MRALVTARACGPDALKVMDQPEPRPAEGEVLVKVKAAGVNFADVLAAQGMYPPAPRLPAVMGFEVAGTVEELGDGVSGLRVGDRVLGGTRFGGHAELAVVTAGALLPLPADWSFAEGAAFPVSYATAYAGLCRFGGLRRAERVLVHAAAGGVGIASTQIARALGAEVFGTASSRKQDALRDLGVHHPIDYEAGNFVESVRRAGESEAPIDLAMDSISGSSFRRSWSLLAPGGRLVCLGASSLVTGERRNIARSLLTVLRLPWFGAFSLMTQSKSVIGVNVLCLWDAKGSLTELIAPLTDLIPSGRLRPVIAERFSLSQGADAYRYLIGRRNVGKVVLDV